MIFNFSNCCQAKQSCVRQHRTDISAAFFDYAICFIFRSFSSPAPLGSWVSLYSIGRLRRPHSSNIFSETAGPFKAKFHMAPQRIWGNKSTSKWFWSYDQYGRHAHIVITLQKSSSPEPAGPWLSNMVYIIGGLGPYNFCSNDDPWLTFSFFMARSKHLIGRSRVCHNHKPQPTLDTKRKRKRTKTYTRKTNKQMYEKHKDQLPLAQAMWSEC